MERQAKDGTVYQQVGNDSWSPVTRQAKDGTVYKKIGDDSWSPMQVGGTTSPKEPTSDVTGAVRTAGRSALEMITLGASEPLFAGIHAVDKTFQQGVEALAKKVSDEGGDDFDLVKAIKANYAEDIGQRRKDKEEHPYANFGGSVAGAFVPAGPANALISKITAGLGKYAPAAARLVPEISSATGAGKLANAVLSGAGKVARGAAEGAATSVGFEAPRQAIERTTGFIKPGDADAPSLSSVAGVGALIGGGIPIVGAGLRASGSAGAWVGKKAMSAFLGPSEEHINYYLQNPEAVNGAKSIGELKDKVDGIVNSLRESVDAGDMSVAEAKAHLKDIEQAAANHRAESNYDFQVTATEVKQQLRDARSRLAQRLEKETQKLKDVKAPIDMADEVVTAGRDLKNKNVVEGSQKAMETLSPTDTAKTYDVYKELQGLHNGMNIGGVAPGTPEAKAAQSSIKNLMDMVGSLPGELSPEEAKKFLRQLDDSERAVYGQPGFTDDVSRAYKAVRQNIDSQLKSNPAYAAAMRPVAEARGLMEMIPRDKSEAISLLNRIASPTNTVERESLIKLGKLTGRDFETGVANYLEAQGKLKDPNFMRQLEESLPEFGQVKSAESASRMLEGPSAKREFVERRLTESGLPQKQATAEKALEDSRGQLELSKEKLQPFKDITPRNSQQLLERAGTKIKGEERIQLKQQLDELSKMSDIDFHRAVKNLQTKKSFEGTDIQGSRKVNLFALAFGAIGGAVGGVLGPGGIYTGAAVGGTLGALADKYGPATAKIILDGVIKMKESPSLAKIQALNIPTEAKAFLTREFAEARSSGAGQIRTGDEPAPTPKKGKEKWANDGLQKLIDHAGPDERDVLESAKTSADPRVKELLIQASDLKPGSKAMADVMKKIKARANGQKVAGGE